MNARSHVVRRQFNDPLKLLFGLGVITPSEVRPSEHNAGADICRSAFQLLKTQPDGVVELPPLPIAIGRPGDRVWRAFAGLRIPDRSRRFADLSLSSYDGQPAAASTGLSSSGPEMVANVTWPIPFVKTKWIT